MTHVPHYMDIKDSDLTPPYYDDGTRLSSGGNAWTPEYELAWVANEEAKKRAKSEFAAHLVHRAIDDIYQHIEDSQDRKQNQAEAAKRRIVELHADLQRFGCQYRPVIMTGYLQGVNERIVLSKGIQYFAKDAGNWLFSDIAIWLMSPEQCLHERGEEFAKSQFWTVYPIKFDVDEGGGEIYSEAGVCIEGRAINKWGGVNHDIVIRCKTKCSNFPFRWTDNCLYEIPFHFHVVRQQLGQKTFYLIMLPGECNVQEYATIPKPPKKKAKPPKKKD